ncbi:hypothetical protein M8312_04045 [Sphingomonas sp. KRR8]|uniref:tetratricopeptide repeat protein n=1 Tax=Sphingomonas sp. KRR8 TaxID=2942996 RepID=UPI0020205FFA|nr:hypothetical protein [Sphingomonas sp. KRR8]URD61691.1 hypothetical protein M8312_04045 [Sphingomonas sp. KRR8]
MTVLRRALVIIAGLLLAGLAIRVAAVLGFAQTRPELAASIWPKHPAVRLSAGMQAIGETVAAGRAPSAMVTAELRAVARRDPLNPGPLLVEGTRAFAAGDLPKADRLLKEASRLDPLAPAPRFLLAQLYFRQNRAEAGLAEVGFLFERLNGDAAPLVPALAQYAAQPGAAIRLKPVLDRRPVVRGQVLSLMADNPANLPSILQLAPHQGGDADVEWRQRLLSSLVDHRDYARAYALWQQFGNVASSPRAAIYNPRFLVGGAPPPFNWRLSSSPAGTAEPQAGGGLHLLYFGRDDTVLADQILLLPAGHYRLSHSLRGEPTGLFWALTCLPGSTRQEAALTQNRFDFVIPAAGCAAQRLELRGTMGDYPMTVDVNLGPLVLTRGRAE